MFFEKKSTKKINKSRFSTTLLFFVLTLFSQPAEATFVDVDTTHPFYNAIYHLKNKEIVSGFSINGHQFFKPLQTLNRVEALKLLMIGSSTPNTKKTAVNFPDIEKNAWYMPYLSTAYDKKIIAGHDDGNFRPGEKVLLAAFLKMLLLSFETEVEAPKADEKWYQPFMRKAKELNLIPGNPLPDQEVSRGEAAEILYRTIISNEKNNAYRPFGIGTASYYHPSLAGEKTANGEIYNPQALTAAHRTLPFGAVLKIYTLDNEKNAILVRINDRGPYHSSRVLDLSEASFEKLAPLSRGIITVHYEVHQSTKTTTALPEEAEPFLLGSDDEVINVPIEVQKFLETEGEKSAKKVPYFSESVGHISVDFFENIKLRKTIPQKIYEGAVVSISGNVKKQGHKKVRLFLIDERGEEILFTGNVSGTSFFFPMGPLEVGKYKVGMTIDGERKSRSFDLEVKKISEKKFPDPQTKISGNLFVEANTLEKSVDIFWKSKIRNTDVFNLNDAILSKLEIVQNSKKKKIFVEGDLDKISFQHDFFKNFSHGKLVSIILYQAISEDKSMANQKEHWQKIDSKNFTLVHSLPDEKDPKIQLENFKTFLRTPGKITIRGQLEDEIILDNRAFLTDSTGNVYVINLVQLGKSFFLELTVENEGEYLLEILDNNGKIMLNKGFYVFKDWVLPAIKKTIPVVKQADKYRQVHWINLVRAENKKQPLRHSEVLSDVAQNYAEKMAQENFIGHEDAEGKKLKDRIQEAGIEEGHFGENLALSNNMELAMEGLYFSGSHRKNMTDRKWKKMGVGMAKKSGKYYIVHIFGE